MADQPLDLSREALVRALGEEQQRPALIEAEGRTGSPGWRRAAMLSHLIGGAADVASTYRSFAAGGHEKNPLVNWMPQNLQMPVGAAMEAGTTYALDKLLKNHPKWRNALQFGIAGLHGGLAISNERETRRLREQARVQREFEEQSRRTAEKLGLPFQ